MKALQEYKALLGEDYPLQIITLGTAILGAVCGMLGCFTVLRKQSLLGDTISHAALPGIALVFLWLGVKDNLIMLLGALVSGVIGTVWIKGIISKTHLKSDTAMGLVLSLFFGFGMLLLTFIQKIPNANQAGLETYLFGQAATLLASDVWLLAISGILCFGILCLFWKEFKVLLFDMDYSLSLGFNTNLLDFILTGMIVLVVVLGLQSVGVVLMSSLLLAPAAAARQWTNRLSVMVGISAIIGALSGIIGTAISTTTKGLPTGPVIVMIATCFVFISFIFSPQRGILFKQIRKYKNRKALKIFKTLALMYDIAKTHENISHPHSVMILNNFQGYSRSAMQELEDQELVVINDNMWHLTNDGYNKAARLFNQETI